MRRLVVLTTAAMVAVMVPQPAQALDEVNTKKLRDGVTVGGILAHERVLQRIANQNDGTRASGTPGYDASAAYVAQRLRAAGYRVTLQEFTFPFFRDLADPTLSQVSPTPTDYETETMTFSGSGEVTGVLVPTNDIVIPPGAEPSTSNSGCDAADFTPAPAGPSVALIQRGTCDFIVKARNAQAAGYDAVVIFNEGQPGRDTLLQGTLGEPFDLPVLGISFADGAALYAATQAGPVTVAVSAETETDPNRTTVNVIADSRGGDANKTVVVGAHLDSVVEGPGINDNGSGSSTILEIAEEISELNQAPRQRLRFAFWGAEELGLLGSEHYVETLSDVELSKIYANLNFDMVGSPNYVRFVYDGDGSDTELAGPPGSAQIEERVHELLRLAEPGVGADRVQRPVRLRAVHRRRHPGRWPVHRRRGDQDRRGGRRLRRHGGPGVRPLLPPGLRRHQQPQHEGAQRDGRRRGARDVDARPQQVGLLRGRQLPHREQAGQGRRGADDGPATP